jgi:hypothetical protein
MHGWLDSVMPNNLARADLFRHDVQKARELKSIRSTWSDEDTHLNALVKFGEVIVENSSNV